MQSNGRQGLEVADIFTIYKNRLNGLSKGQWKVVQDIINCRTATLGGHVLECNKCGHLEQSYNSCRNRHCPKCQTIAKLKWLTNRRSELLPVNYFHLVFTLPSQLNMLILQNKEVLYNLLFKAVSKTLKEVALNPKNLGAQVGFFMILHTWGQNLMDHPHLHVVIPAGGLSIDGKSWVDSKKSYFLPVQVLSSVFRGKYMSLLKKAFKNNKLEFYGEMVKLKDKANFKKLVNTCYDHNWVVYAKRPFGGPKQVLEYLGRYTHRIAISNHRLIKVKDDQVYFRYRDYKDDNNNKVMKLAVEEFMRRFLLHVLPKGFMKIRYYGIFGNKNKKENLELCRELLKSKQAEIHDVLFIEDESTKDLILRVMGIDIELCPLCKKGTMIVISNIKSFDSTV